MMKTIAPGMTVDDEDLVLILDAKEACEAAGVLATQEAMAAVYSAVHNNLASFTTEDGRALNGVVLVEREAISTYDAAVAAGEQSNGSEQTQTTIEGPDGSQDTLAP